MAHKIEIIMKALVNNKIYTYSKNNRVIVLTKQEKLKHEQKEQLKKLTFWNLITLKYFNQWTN